MASSLPAFPQSVLVVETDPTDLEPWRAAAGRASDYNWTSLASWAPSSRLSYLDGGLVVEFPDYHDPSERSYGFIGGFAPEHVAVTVLDYANAHGLPEELRLVPEEVVGRLADFDCVEDRDNFDYLYDVSEMVSLAGRRHRTNRLRRNRFLRTETVSREFCDDGGTADWEKLECFTRLWAERHSEQGQAALELSALRSCRSALGRVPHAHRQILVTSVEVGGDLVAFDVSEVIPGGLSIQHFSHTAQHVIGVREHLRTVVGERLLSQGVHMLNTEQDLGVPGLRTRKMNDAPACLAKKYVLRRVLK